MTRNTETHFHGTTRSLAADIYRIYADCYDLPDIETRLAIHDDAFIGSIVSDMMHTVRHGNDNDLREEVAAVVADLISFYRQGEF